MLDTQEYPRLEERLLPRTFFGGAESTVPSFERSRRAQPASCPWYSPLSAAMRERVGLLLVNLGTPDAPRPPEVRRYLREFLSDPRLLDMPAFLRFLLLELVILPRRPRASAAAYRKIWTPEGSPLLVHSRALAAK